MATDTVAAPALPDDVLEDILGRLPARSVAASQLVCKAWRDLVGERRLLFPLLLPHSVAGLFVNYIDHHRPHFFARPRPLADGGGPRIIDGRFSFIAREKPYACYTVLDHCNGLVLHSGDRFGDRALYLCNPATRRWARLPPRPDDPWHLERRALVAFDPAASPRWEVLLAGDAAWRATECPPATWPWHVFSSTTMRWEEKVFVREGEAAGTVAGLQLNSLDERYNARWRYGAYWQGALYMHCRGEFVSRLSLSTNKYQVIKSPIDLEECQQGTTSFIGRSGDGICFGALDNMAQLRVWILDESDDNKMEWVLNHRSVVDPNYQQMRYDGPWTIADAYNDYKNISTYDDESDTEDEEASQEDGMEWNSDEDDIIDPADGNEYGYYSRNCVTFLGFHPYKEVIFLQHVNIVMGNLGVAYHLDSGKVQYLGELNPGCYNLGLYESFVYTPCLIGV